MTDTEVSPTGLLVVWHSRTGASEQMANHAYQAARQAEPALAVRIVRCDQADELAMKIATGWRLKPIQEPIIINTAAQSAQQILAPKTLDQTALAKAQETGAAMASGLVMGIF